MRERSAASTYKKETRGESRPRLSGRTRLDSGFPHVFIPSAQVLELNFLTVLPHGGDDVESKGESAPSVLE